MNVAGTWTLFPVRAAALAAALVGLPLLPGCLKPGLFVCGHHNALAGNMGSALERLDTFAWCLR
jgi:hypothetical protein